MRLLLVEDDERIGAFVQKGLAQDGHVVDWAHTGEDGLSHLLHDPCDAAIVDIMLPGKTGIDVVREARRRKVHTPVIALSARASVDDRIVGLDAGADDYLTNPFSYAELVARLHALQRRAVVAQPGFVLSYGGVTLDLRMRKVTRDGTSWRRSRRRTAARSR